MAPAPCEDAMKVVEMTPKDSEHEINLVNKSMAGLERIDSNFERSSVGKMLSTNTACYSEIIHERKSQLMMKTSLLF